MWVQDEGLTASTLEEPSIELQQTQDTLLLYLAFSLVFIFVYASHRQTCPKG